MKKTKNISQRYKKNKTSKKANNSIKKIQDTNDLFTLQIKDILKKYDLEENEMNNLNQLITHLNNLNQLFTNFKN